MKIVIGIIVFIAICFFINKPKAPRPLTPQQEAEFNQMMARKNAESQTYGGLQRENERLREENYKLQNLAR